MCNKSKKEIDMHICHVEVLNKMLESELNCYCSSKYSLNHWFTISLLLCNTAIMQSFISRSKNSTFKSNDSFESKMKKKNRISMLPLAISAFLRDIAIFNQKDSLDVKISDVNVITANPRHIFYMWMKFCFSAVVVVATKNRMLTRINWINSSTILNWVLMRLDPSHFDYSYHFCNHVCESYLICKAIFDILINSNFSIDK